MNTLEILERLVGFDTVSANSNLAMIDYVEALLKGCGFRVTRLQSPCGAKAGLHAEIGPEVEGGLLLLAHSDVVPVEGQDWTHPPFRLTAESARLYGRGTTDMKGFLASALALACDLDPAALARPLSLIISYDEEIGCVGIAQIKERLAPLLRAPRLCIVGEPTEMKVAVGHKGKTAYRAVFQGEAGHSALAPRFQNALHLAADFMRALRDLQHDLEISGPQDHGYDIPYSTVHVGILQGGTALNIVPDRAVMRFETREITAPHAMAIRCRIEAIARSFDSDTGIRPVGCEITNAYPELEIDPAGEDVRHLIALSGTCATRVAFGTEAGVFSSLGIQTVVCGPGSMEGQGHKADEFIERAQLAACDSYLHEVARTYLE